jgi:hypothetical protein
MRRDSSRVSSLAAARRPGSSSRSGILSIGAENCTEAGVCHFVGAAQDCVLVPPPPQDPCYKRGVPLGSNCVSQKICHPGVAPGVDLPVSVLAESPAGSVIIRVQEKNYATGKDHLSVIYHGVRIPLMKYDQCYSPARMSSSRQLADRRVHRFHRMTDALDAPKTHQHRREQCLACLAYGRL